MDALPVNKTGLFSSKTVMQLTVGPLYSGFLPIDNKRCNVE